MIATLALSAALLAAPAGELVWWRPDAPATGLAVGDGGVWRGLGSGRSEWWPLDGDPPRLMARTTPCPSVLETYDPPRSRMPDRALPWGPVVAHGWSEGCALTSTAAGPLVRYRRGVVAGVVARGAPARLVATDPACARGAVVDDETLRIVPLTDAAGDGGVTVALGQVPTDLRLTDEAAIVADLDGALTLFRPDGQRLADIDPGAPLSCAATGRGLIVVETVEARTGAHAMIDGGLRWGRPAVDDELGQAWSVDPPSPFTALAVDPAGRWVAAVVAGRARIWRPMDGTFQVLPGPALDVVVDPDRGTLAVRGPESVGIWRMDGAPRRLERVKVPVLTAAVGPTLAFLPGGQLATLSDDALVPVRGIGGRPIPVDEPRALLTMKQALVVVGDTEVTAFRVGRQMTAGQRRVRRPGPTLGARLDCAGAPVSRGIGGWGPLIGGDRRADPTPVRLCPPRGGAIELALVGDGVLATTVVRQPGQPPIRREVRAPLHGDPHGITLDEAGRVTALLDGRAVVRWQPGADPDRLTWVVVDGRDILAGGGRISGSPAARRSLAWWTPSGLIPASEAPAAETALRLPEGAPR